MKIFINTTNWTIVKQEQEYPVLVGNNYVDELKVYYDADPATEHFYPTLNLLKPNNRKIGPIAFDAGSVESPNPSSYTDEDSNTWYCFKFTLSSANGQLDVNGKIQITITTNYYDSTTNAITKQRNVNTLLNVFHAVTVDDCDILILGENEEDVITSLYTLVQTLNTSVASLQTELSALSGGVVLNVYTKAETDAKIREIVNEMFADVSEEEF